MSIHQTNVIIIGSEPPPIGGITSHVFNFLKKYETVPHPALRILLVDRMAKSIPDSKSEWVWRLAFWKQPLKSIYAFIGHRGIVHIHSSTGDSVFPVVFFVRIMAPRCRLLLTLHHGDLQCALKKQSRLERFSYRIMLIIVDHVICVSRMQQTYLSSMFPNIDTKVINSYIQPVVDPLIEKGQSPIPSELRTNCDIIIGSSGYGMPYYRYDNIIDAIVSLQNKINRRIGVCLVIYGRTDHHYLQKLYSMAKGSIQLAIIGPLSQVSFQSFLYDIDLYVRANSVDSYGLAVAEALHQGTPVVASNACERANGARLFQVDNQTALTAAIEASLSTNKTSNEIPNKTNDAFDTIVETYFQMLGLREQTVITEDRG